MMCHRLDKDREEGGQLHFFWTPAFLNLLPLSTLAAHSRAPLTTTVHYKQKLAHYSVIKIIIGCKSESDRNIKAHTPIILIMCGHINFQHSSTFYLGLGCHMTYVQWSPILLQWQCDLDVKLVCTPMLLCLTALWPQLPASKVNTVAKLLWIIDGGGSGSYLR